MLVCSMRLGTNFGSSVEGAEIGLTDHLWVRVVRMGMYQIWTSKWLYDGGEGFGGRIILAILCFIVLGSYQLVWGECHL